MNAHASSRSIPHLQHFWLIGIWVDFWTVDYQTLDFVPFPSWKTPLDGCTKTCTGDSSHWDLVLPETPLAFPWLRQHLWGRDEEQAWRRQTGYEMAWGLMGGPNQNIYINNTCGQPKHIYVQKPTQRPTCSQWLGRLNFKDCPDSLITCEKVFWGHQWDTRFLTVDVAATSLGHRARLGTCGLYSRWPIPLEAQPKQWSFEHALNWNH